MEIYEQQHQLDIYGHQHQLLQDDVGGQADPEEVKSLGYPIDPEGVKSYNQYSQVDQGGPPGPDEGDAYERYPHPSLMSIPSINSLKRHYSQGDQSPAGSPYAEMVQDLQDDYKSNSHDQRLLSFKKVGGDHTIVDNKGRIHEMEIDAQLLGMFFLSELPGASSPEGGDTTNGPLNAEVTCYRRNLFQISGHLCFPQIPLSVLTPETGETSLIKNMEVSVSAIESVDGHPVRLIVIPWKTPPPNTPEVTQASDQEPPPLPLIPWSDEEEENGGDHYAVYPIGWRRLQFRIATANGRRKELQQHFVLHLKLHGTLADGQKVVLSELTTAPIIVRGRSPRDFQARKEIPLLGSSAGSREQRLVETGYGIVAQAVVLNKPPHDSRPRVSSTEVPRSAFTFTAPKQMLQSPMQMQSNSNTTDRNPQSQVLTCHEASCPLSDTAHGFFNRETLDEHISDPHRPWTAVAEPRMVVEDANDSTMWIRHGPRPTSPVGGGFSQDPPLLRQPSIASGPGKQPLMTASFIPPGITHSLSIPQPMAILPLCNDSGYGSLAARSVATGKFQDTAVQQPTDLPRPYSGTDEAMETASVLSNNNSILRNPNLDRYISAFADQLAACVPPGFGATTTRTTTGGLDHLLKVFAVRLSHESTERPQRHLMYIAYRFRSDIVNHVQRSLNTSDDVESDVASSDSDHDARDTEPVMDLDEKIRHLWDRRTCIPQSSELDPTTESLDDVDDTIDLDPGISELFEYCDILVNTSAYRWLKTSLETSSALYIPSPRTSQAGADFPKPAALVGGSPCPRCEKGRLFEKVRSPFQYKDKWLECERADTQERPCNYIFRHWRPISSSQNQTPPASEHCHISDAIVQSYAAKVPTQISRTMTQRLTLQFTVAWDPVLFAQGQQYDAPMSTVLARAITLTGYGNNLQATTCQKYVEQTWPYTGTAVLELVQRVFDSKEGGSKKTTLGDSTELIVDFVDGQLNLDATGSVFSVAEVAEQVAWIGAALRSSPSDDQAAYVSARILDLRLSGTSVFGNVHTTSGSCRIEFDTELLHDAELAVAGKCWRGMFGNPVIVRGFPIPRRADTDTGLEVPLDMVARLTNCQRVVNFAGTTFIKGFAAMLTAVKVVGDTVYWHLSYNADGSYISYAEWEASGSFASQTLSMDSIARSRHVVGWSDNVRNYTGAPDAEYEIEWTELPSPNSSCVLEKVTVSGSAIPFITPGTSFLIGVKDKPLHLGFGSGNDYMGNLMTIGKRHVVFYDTNEKRAWLVDGVSAVLHLLRAYLKFYVEDDRLGSYFMYSHGDIEEARPNVAYTGAKAAYEVLTSEKNQSLPLYPKRAAVSEEKTVTLGRNLNEETTTIKLTHSNFTLAERVEQIVHILLQITAYHDHGSTQSGYGFRIKSSPCHHIEGFEFMDVATRHDTLWPKVATVQAMSVGWVHLIRSLHAVTLFGIGFGELFRPALRKDQKQPCCIPTSLMPTGKDFLAVYGADLQDMLRTGSKRRDPWRLAGNLHWHSPGEAAFESCKCKTDPDNPKQPHSQDLPAPERKGFKGFKTLLGKFNTTTNNNNKQSKQPLLDPSNRVQVLLPATFPHLFGRGLHSPTRIAPNGAVIFGHAWSFPLRWSLTKDVPPEEGEPDPPSVDDVAGLMSDSGVGTSVDSSNSGPSPPAASFYGLGSNDGFLKCEDEPSEGGSLAGEDSRGEVRRKRSFDGVGGVIESSRAKVRRLESGEHTSG